MLSFSVMTESLHCIDQKYPHWAGVSMTNANVLIWMLFIWFIFGDSADLKAENAQTDKGQKNTAHSFNTVQHHPGRCHSGRLNTVHDSTLEDFVMWTQHFYCSPAWLDRHKMCLNTTKAKTAIIKGGVSHFGKRLTLASVILRNRNAREHARRTERHLLIVGWNNGVCVGSQLYAT